MQNIKNYLFILMTFVFLNPIFANVNYLWVNTQLSTINSYFTNDRKVNLATRICDMEQLLLYLKINLVQPLIMSGLDNDDYYRAIGNGIKILKWNLDIYNGISVGFITCSRNTAAANFNSALSQDLYPGFSPLHASVLYNDLNLVKIFVFAGADLYLKIQKNDYSKYTDYIGLTALELAEKLGYQDIVNFLKSC
ncbi:hypothetical protein GF322_04710 [Candidatus Dependentiae bacterium]|nr:hypothetical protein [Candidatus Dependentiae bacterium]